MTKDEALKLALEALESCYESDTSMYRSFDKRKTDSAITAIKEALAQPEQEPVAWMYEVNNAHTCLDLFEPPDDAYDEGTLYPLYTTPPQRKPLTEQEIGAILEDINAFGTRLYTFARAIEAAHGIKEQE